MRTTTRILDLASALSPLVNPAAPSSTTRDDWNRSSSTSEAHKANAMGMDAQIESLGSELMGFTVDQNNKGLGAAKHGSHYSHSSHSSSVY
jgi:hypothetical protein